MQPLLKEPAMFSLFGRPAGLALLSGLIALGGSAAEAGSFGANLNIRTQNFAQPVYVGGRQPNVGLGTGTAAPPVSYGGPGPGSRAHLFEKNTQFDGMTDTSASGKLPK
jgi:hypothetical protein